MNLCQIPLCVTNRLLTGKVKHIIEGCYAKLILELIIEQLYLKKSIHKNLWNAVLAILECSIVVNHGLRVQPPRCGTVSSL